MAYETLKSIITQNIKTNGQESITGIVLQQILLRMVDELGYTPAGEIATKEWVNTQLADYASQTWVNNKLGDYLPLTGGTLTGALMTNGTTQGIRLRAYFDNDTIAIQRFENNDWVSVCSLSGPGYITGSTYHGNQYIVNGGTSDEVLCADGSVKTLAELKAALNAI